MFTSKDPVQATVGQTRTSKPPLVVIVGPTASGKSDLAMQAARRFGGEIICADSRTVYKGLDIGTAKPTASDRAEIPHHLVDVVGPDESFSAADFKRLAEAAITDIANRGKLPILVGGTGLYVDAILFDFQFGPAADPQKRAELESLDVEQLQNICRQSNIVLPQNNTNKRHLIRAIELGGLVEPDRSHLRQNTLVVGITVENDALLSRIIKRTEAMLKAGVVEETKRGGRNYGWNAEAMSGSVYRILHRYISGEMSLQAALAEFVKSDLQLAKRQRTWFRRNPFIEWSDDRDLLLKKIINFSKHKL